MVTITQRLSGATLTPAQREKEQALLRAIVLDFFCYSALVLAAIASGSLTILAELPRGGLLYTIEIISLVTLRRSHRGRFFAFEYGIGKIERVITSIIGLGLFVAAAFTLNATIERVANPTVLPTPAMILGVAVAGFNFAINLYCAGDFVRANRTEESLILASQVRSRLVKTVASGVVVAVLVVATWLSDPTGAAYVDAFGALFVIGYMVVTGKALLQESIPDLLDRALPESQQLLLMRVMSRHFDDFESFGSIKSRHSGGNSFITVELAFQGDMALAEVRRRCDAVRNEIIELIPDAFVEVIPQAAET